MYKKKKKKGNFCSKSNASRNNSVKEGKEGEVTIMSTQQLHSFIPHEQNEHKRTRKNPGLLQIRIELTVFGFPIQKNPQQWWHTMKLK